MSLVLNLVHKYWRFNVTFLHVGQVSIRSVAGIYRAAAVKSICFTRVNLYLIAVSYVVPGHSKTAAIIIECARGLHCKRHKYT